MTDDAGTVQFTNVVKHFKVHHPSFLTREHVEQLEKDSEKGAKADGKRARVDDGGEAVVNRYDEATLKRIQTDFMVVAGKGFGFAENPGWIQLWQQLGLRRFGSTALSEEFKRIEKDLVHAHGVRFQAAPARLRGEDGIVRTHQCGTQRGAALGCWTCLLQTPCAPETCQR